ncbi:YkgJ family cysteine cluster protein [Thermodesulfobacteriota bacterium]
MNMHFTRNIIKELLWNSTAQRQELEKVYSLLPATRCRRRTHCCSMLPEMALIEALAVIDRLKQLEPDRCKRIFIKIITYFFLNPLEILGCPFLDGRDCIIYQSRFFGCRAYGLWSSEHYQKIIDAGRRAKKYFQQQWHAVGIDLPSTVIDYYMPYCADVETEAGEGISDQKLIDVSNQINKLSQRFHPWHDAYGQGHFSDLSFLFASSVFGRKDAVRMKLAVVKDVVAKGSNEMLDKIIDQLPEYCEYLD